MKIVQTEYGYISQKDTSLYFMTRKLCQTVKTSSNGFYVCIKFSQFSLHFND